ncbi:ATP-binding protein [Desulfosoma caldarium]|uniref:ATP-dependent DNA helicase RecG n=1 Tax=Desulfosoma caldarium TaxID=610254 RepID=A0A3N1US31_9BACT|nr:ATP-binding protein [Desulfosoma caldarium]ROQ92179.1 ATP-dependent DNA helicase RecG [Desulfosoma caldarium]
MGATELEMKALLAKGETITVEFKSDLKVLPDRDLLAAVVAMANTKGGRVLLGVEDDGTVTGVHPNHQNTVGLAALIANRTNPSVAVKGELIDWGDKKILSIHVPKSRSIVSTSDGLVLRRRLLASGRPEAVPFYPHEFIRRQSALGLIDPSAIALVALSAEDLNPLERQRLREALRRYGGDRTLLPLADEELDAALGLTTTVDGVRRPTVAGLLLMGREELIRQHLPAHEVAFQVLEGTDVRVNELFRKPFLQTFKEVEVLFKARVVEEEIQVGLFRVPIPNFDRRAFREGFINALVHCDYASLGAVHVRLDDDGLTMINPGGFVEGVTIQNLSTVPPRSRNPLLADIFKRIGLAERTGRGIDRIYEGMLRYGRPAPDYTQSTASLVVLLLSRADADTAFLKMILSYEQRTGAPMPINSLIVLSRLRQEPRLTTTDLVQYTQKSEISTRATLEKLVEAGLVDAQGSSRGRSYILIVKVYKKSGQKASYVRQVEFDPIQQEQMVLTYIDKHGSIKRADVMELCRLSGPQAYHLLNRLRKQGKILKHGEKRHAFYTRKS